MRMIDISGGFVNVWVLDNVQIASLSFCAVQIIGGTRKSSSISSSSYSNL